MKIIATNWINVAGIIAASVCYGMVINLAMGYTVLQALLATFFLLFGFGLILWLLFIPTLIILDLVLWIFNGKNLYLKLAIQWLLIAWPVFYLALLYERQRWLYILLIIVLAITQYRRQRLIVMHLIAAGRAGNDMAS